MSTVHLIRPNADDCGYNPFGAPLPGFDPELAESQRPLKRRKRQVPCEVGPELDEYVDSLFRFGRRLIRVMEPFSVRPTTIETLL